jgi:hypothetical protein
MLPDKFTCCVLDICADDVSAASLCSLDAWASSRVPAFSLADYARRLCHQLDADESVLAIALVLLGRFKERVRTDPGLQGIKLDKLSAYRLSLTCIVVARLWHEDISGTHAYAANAGGVTPAELTRLVTRMLSILQFRCHVSGPEYDEASKEISRQRSP